MTRSPHGSEALLARLARAEADADRLADALDSEAFGRGDPTDALSAQRALAAHNEAVAQR